MLSCFPNRVTPSLPHPTEPSSSSDTSSGIISHEPKPLPNPPSTALSCDYPPIPFRSNNTETCPNTPLNNTYTTIDSARSVVVGSGIGSDSQWSTFIRRLGNKSAGGGMSRTWVKKGRDGGAEDFGSGYAGGEGGDGGMMTQTGDVRSATNPQTPIINLPPSTHPPTTSSPSPYHTDQSQPFLSPNPDRNTLRSPHSPGPQYRVRAPSSARSESFCIPNDRVGHYRGMMKEEERKVEKDGKV